MDGVRQQLFAGAGFAQQQHGAVLTGGAAGGALELLHGAGVAHHIGQGVFIAARQQQRALRAFQLALQAGEFGQQRLDVFAAFIQHKAQRANHLAVLVLERHPRNHKAALADCPDVQQDGAAGFEHFRHLRMRGELQNMPAQRVFRAGQAQGFQVGFADPHHTGVTIHRHRAVAVLDPFGQLLGDFFAPEGQVRQHMFGVVHRGGSQTDVCSGL